MKKVIYLLVLCMVLVRMLFPYRRNWCRYGRFLSVCLNQEAVRLSDVSMEQIISTFAVYCVAVMQSIYC